MVVRLGAQQPMGVNLARIERALAQATSTWTAGLRDALTANMDEGTALSLWVRFASVFPAAYTDQVSPAAAVSDIAELAALGAGPDAMRLRLHRASGETATQLHLTLYRRGEAASISEVVPVMENFGLRVIAEHPYEIRGPEGAQARIQDFELAHATPFDLGRLGERLTAAIESVWSGETENDGFNRLLPLTGLAVREIMVLRACGRYLLQTGLPFSQSYMERVLRTSPGIALKLFRLFDRRLNPHRSAAARAKSALLEESIEHELAAVTSPGCGSHPARLPARDSRHAAHQLLADHRRSPATVPVIQAGLAGRYPNCRCRVRCLKCLSTRRRSRPSICAWRRSHGAASAGRIGARTSGPKYWA